MMYASTKFEVILMNHLHGNTQKTQQTEERINVKPNPKPPLPLIGED